MIFRDKESEVLYLLKHFSCVAITGPRQCGKSTLAARIVSRFRGAVYLDLENPDDRAKLQEPTLFLSQYNGKLVCLDEVQFMPEIFNVLRSLIDKHRRNGQFLVLGSASPHMLQRTSETLAGRIAFTELLPFSLKELTKYGKQPNDKKLWMRGGFPRSFLPPAEQVSYLWRKNFIQTFLERDLSVFGINVSPESMRKIWMMCAHLHGQPLNYSNLGNSLGVSHSTAAHYIDILCGTFMLQKIEPFYANLEKRIRKASKIYLTDSGILHALLNIRSMEELLSHPVAGFSWEGFVLQQLRASLPDWKISYITTSNQAEIDFILSRGKRNIAIECKLSQSPVLSRGFYNTVNELKIKKGYVVCPVKEAYPINSFTEAISIQLLINILK